MIKIAITGGNGLVGSRIIELLNKDFEFINLSSDILDITNKNQVNEVLEKINFDILLHLAAYTNVAKANEEKDLCFRINVIGTKNLIEKVINKKKKFIYISTDFVFNGKNPPYFEDSKTNPIGIYGLSKYEGEKVVNSNGMIVRISYPYRAKFDKKNDFFRTFKSFLEQKKSLSLITNSLMTPTFIDDIAYGLKYLVNNYSPEIFHLTGSQSYSPYDLGLIVSKKFNFDINLIKTTTYEAYIKLKPGIPQYSVIKSKKNNFLKMSNFEEGLEKIIKQFKNY